MKYVRQRETDLRTAGRGAKPQSRWQVPIAAATGVIVWAWLTNTCAQAVVLNAVNDVWIRELQPNAKFEGDLISVWNSHNTGDSGKRRYGVVEFDLSGLSGMPINLASIGLWNFAHGFSDQSKAIKLSAVYINTTGGTTTVPNMTWNAYQTEYAGSAVALGGLGAFNLPAQSAPNAYSYSAAATASDRALITSAASSGNKRLTLVFIADEVTMTESAHSWGDGETDGSMSPQLLINEEQVTLTLRINTTTGTMSIVNPGMEPTVDTSFDIDGYVISSPAGALNVSGFTGIGGTAQSDWQIIAPTATNLTELNLSTSTTFLEGDARWLGVGYVPGAVQDAGLTFQYNIAGSGPVTGQVEYITGGLTGDYNGNGIVDGSDFIVWRNGESPDSSQAGYNVWRSQFGQSASGIAGGLEAHALVPEHSTSRSLAALLAIAVASARRWLPLQLREEFTHGMGGGAVVGRKGRAAHAAFESDGLRLLIGDDDKR